MALDPDVGLDLDRAEEVPASEKESAQQATGNEGTVRSPARIQ